MAKAERNQEGCIQTRDGNFKVCSLCPLLGDPGYILAKGNPCEEEAYRNCSQLLGETTTPKRTESGIAYLLNGDISNWKRKHFRNRG